MDVHPVHLHEHRIMQALLSCYLVTMLLSLDTDAPRSTLTSGPIGSFSTPAILLAVAKPSRNSGPNWFASDSFNKAVTKLQQLSIYIGVAPPRSQVAAASPKSAFAVEQLIRNQ